MGTCHDAIMELAGTMTETESIEVVLVEDDQRLADLTTRYLESLALFSSEGVGTVARVELPVLP